eukprot:1071415-Rhodomonas_salina.1
MRSFCLPPSLVFPPLPLALFPPSHLFPLAGFGVRASGARSTQTETETETKTETETETPKTQSYSEGVCMF